MPIIAIQGEPGSFSHEATMRLFPGATLLPCAVSRIAFDAILSGQADAAVLPIENSLAGSVLEHYDLLLQHPVTIQREMLLRIEHNLIVYPGATLNHIRRVLSHPIALAQCNRFFVDHPSIQPTAAYDTAGSVKQLVALQDLSVGAIAPARAASEYGGEILFRNLEDNPQNYTRFLVVRRNDIASNYPNPKHEGIQKASLAFTLPNQPGALVSALQIFANLGANLTRLESRPVLGQPWHYVFYADYCFSNPSIADQALAGLTAICPSVKELGRFPTAE
jgi:prephenate dehydratase